MFFFPERALPLPEHIVFTYERFNLVYLACPSFYFNCANAACMEYSGVEKLLSNLFIRIQGT